MSIWSRLKYLEQRLERLSKEQYDSYLENKHGILLIQDYLGVEVVKPNCKDKLVKKGGPEQGF